ncbi:putative UDP-glucose lipid carrier transferase [Paenibacillus sp. P1XP2]|nr:putative UDP-glucose lipid carrier transferase [Paenibacillus sp. P1XP2]
MIRKNQEFLTQMYVLTDFVFIQFSFLLAWWLRFKSGWIPYEAPLPIETYAMWSFIYGAIAVLTGMLIALYSPKRKKRFADEFIKIVQVHAISIFVLLSLMFFVKEINISRSYLAIYMVSLVMFILFYRYILKVSLKVIREKGYNRQFVLIVGAGSLGKRFYQNLKQYRRWGMRWSVSLTIFSSGIRLKRSGINLY